MSVFYTLRGVALVVGAGLVLGCGTEARSASPQQAGAPQGTGSSVAKVEFTVDTATVQLPLELPAQLYVEHDAIIVARSAGTIDSLFAELGDHVPAGKLLARMESAEQEISLVSAEAAYENLTRMAVRARTLTKSGGTTAAGPRRSRFGGWAPNSRTI